MHVGVNREVACHACADIKLLSYIKSMYANSLACIGIKGGKKEAFRIDRGVGQWIDKSSRLLSAHIDRVLKEMKVENGSEIFRRERERRVGEVVQVQE